MKDERWMPIPGWDHYEASSLGRIRSVDHSVVRKNRWGDHVASIKGRMLTPKTTRDGYLRVNLSDCGTVKTRTVHSLVMLAFCGDRPDGEQINHIDCDKKNNTLENLEYCTQSSNELHAYAHGLKCVKGERHSRSKLTNSDVRQIRELAKVHTHKDVASRFGISPGTVSKVVCRTNWRHVQ